MSRCDLDFTCGVFLPIQPGTAGPFSTSIGTERWGIMSANSRGRIERLHQEGRKANNQVFEALFEDEYNRSIYDQLVYGSADRRNELSDARARCRPDQDAE